MATDRAGHPGPVCGHLLQEHRNIDIDVDVDIDI